MKTLFLLLATVLITSCTHYNVKVDSISAVQQEEKQTFTIMPENGSTDDLQFYEFAAVAARGLEKAGFKLDTKNPEITIYLSYSVDKGQKVAHSDLMKVKQFNGDTAYTNINYTSKTHLRTVTLKAVKEGQMVWGTNILSDGSSGDLRLVFPYLIAAGVPYFGKNTGQQVSTSVSEFNPLAGELRKPASAK